MDLDPVSSLIHELEARHEADDVGSHLQEAADLIPKRTATSTKNLLDSPELSRFRMHYAAGKVEASLVAEALAILRTFLIARGLLRSSE